MWLPFWITLMAFGFVAFLAMLVLVGFGAFQELKEMLCELRESKEEEKRLMNADER